MAGFEHRTPSGDDANIVRPPEEIHFAPKDWSRPRRLSGSKSHAEYACWPQGNDEGSYSVVLDGQFGEVPS